jgi:hypothetical protein
MNTYKNLSSKFLKITSFALAAIFVSQTVVLPSAMADSGTAEFESFDKELNDLDTKIQEHLKRAREASFWKPEHTVAQPGTAVKTTSSTAAPSAPQVKSNISPSSAVSAPPSSKTTAATAPVTTPTVKSMPAASTTAASGASFAAPKTSDHGAVYQPASGTNIVPARRLSIDSGSSMASHQTPSAVPDAKQILDQNYDQMDEVDREIASRTHVSGTYRAAFGVGRNRNFTGNDSNPDLQDRDFHYLFGERQYNTFDPAIYSQYQLDIDSQVTKNDSVFVQIVADPWSYVGQTSEIVVPDSTGTDNFRIKQKYWGPNNSTVPYIVKSQLGNSAALPELEAENGHTQAFTTAGFGFGNTFTVPEQEIDYEFRPLRKAWWDHQGDIWHVRLFALADQNQVMTTDDPLMLSNRKDFWEHSAWLEQWQPIQTFNPIGVPIARSPVIRRGFYNDEEAFYAKDSSGNYLTLLRGGAAEADFGRTYLGMMLASRYGLWDEYQEFDNIPGVIRLKHQVTEPWMIGATYTYRVGMIDREPDTYNQVISFDTKYYTNETDYLYGQAAGSRDELDRLSSYKTAYEGMAYVGGFVSHVGDTNSGITRIGGDFTWIDTEFKETLSNYTSLRDDEFWGNHISWAKIPADVDPFKIGTGVDYGRYVARLNLATSMPDKGVDNIFDVRHVRDTDSNSYIENVIRDETTWKFAPDWTFKNFMRFHMLPRTLSDREPFISGYSSPALNDPALKEGTYYENVLIDPGLNANRRSFGQGLEWEPNHQWTVSGTFELTNDIPDFPRGLLNNTYLTTAFQDPNQSNVWLYRNQAFLYRQDIFDLPPYDYFSIVKERVTYRHSDSLQFIFHAAQNTYTLWAPIDDNVEHQGISVDWQITDKWSAFFDYTHSHLADIPKLIATNFTTLEFEDNHNFYTRLRYRINSNAVLTMEYGVFGQTFYEGSDALPVSAYSVTTFSLPTVDTEHLFRLSLDGEF